MRYCYNMVISGLSQFDNPNEGENFYFRVVCSITFMRSVNSNSKCCAA
jgi:pentatricopeptide repeat protein